MTAVLLMCSVIPSQAVTILADDNFTLSSGTNTSPINNTQSSASAFATTMGGVDITGIAFRHGVTPGAITYIDNLTVSVVPEPSAALLLSVGLASHCLARRRVAR